MQKVAIIVALILSVALATTNVVQFDYHLGVTDCSGAVVGVFYQKSTDSCVNIAETGPIQSVFSGCENGKVVEKNCSNADCVTCSASVQTTCFVIEGNSAVPSCVSAFPTPASIPANSLLSTSDDYSNTSCKQPNSVLVIYDTSCVDKELQYCRDGNPYHKKCTDIACSVGCVEYALPLTCNQTSQYYCPSSASTFSVISSVVVLLVAILAIY